MQEEKDRGFPYEQTPMAEGRFGQPEDCIDLVNRYGTYNIQPTNEQENLFPMIAQGLPKKWRGLKYGKEKFEQQG